MKRSKKDKKKSSKKSKKSKKKKSKKSRKSSSDSSSSDEEEVMRSAITGKKIKRKVFLVVSWHPRYYFNTTQPDPQEPARQDK